MTARLLYVMKRAIPDLEPLVFFLSTRISKSDEDDCKNLNRSLLWVDNTIENKHVIVAIILSEVFKWIDAAYAVNNNIRSHTGGAVLMTCGIIHGKSSKKKG